MVIVTAASRGEEREMIRRKFGEYRDWSRYVLCLVCYLVVGIAEIRRKNLHAFRCAIGEAVSQ